MDNSPPAFAPVQSRLPGFLWHIGVVVIAFGVVLTAIGSISLFSSYVAVGPSRYYWAAFLGIPLIAVGSAFTQSENFANCDLSLCEEDISGTYSASTGQRVRREAVIACPHCQATNLQTANFCNQCGCTLKQPACPGCGAKLAGNARFCTYCGKARV